MYVGLCDMLCAAMKGCSWWLGNAHIGQFACRVVKWMLSSPVCHLVGGDRLISYVVCGVGIVDVSSMYMCCVDGGHVGRCVFAGACVWQLVWKGVLSEPVRDRTAEGKRTSIAKGIAREASRGTRRTTLGKWSHS
jgi:hypothetical protein